MAGGRQVASKKKRRANGQEKGCRKHAKRKREVGGQERVQRVRESDREENRVGRKKGSPFVETNTHSRASKLSRGCLKLAMRERRVKRESKERGGRGGGKGGGREREQTRRGVRGERLLEGGGNRRLRFVYLLVACK